MMHPNIESHPLDAAPPTSPTPHPTPSLCFEVWDRDSRYLKLRKAITKAVASYQLIEAHDKIMVGVSGGKDSAVQDLLRALLPVEARDPL